MSTLPKGWSEAKGDDVFSLVTSGSRGWASHYSESGAKFLRVQNVQRDRIDLNLADIQHVRPPSDAEGSRTRLKEGDIVITITADLGRVGLVPAHLGEAYVNQHVALARPRSVAMSPYLAWFAMGQDAQRQLGLFDRGATRAGLGLKDIGALLFSIPPLAEQRRIVTKIDSLSGRSKRARAHLDHIPLLVKRYKQAVLAAAFRGDLTGGWRVGNATSVSMADLERRRERAWQIERQHGRIRGRYSAADGIEWRPSINLPSEWVWSSVDQVTSLVQYGTSAKTSDASEGVAVLRMGNIQDGALDLRSLKYLPSDHSDFPELLLEDGDVLFNRTNSAELVGKTAVYKGVPQRASFASYLIRLRCCGLLPQLLSGFINSLFGREWVASVVNQQVGQANVNGTKLRQLGVPVMPEAEQHEIARRVEHAFTWIDHLTTEATSARMLVDHLDQAVLTKAFRGELVPQDPADEPACVLLDGIKAKQSTETTSTSARRAKAYKTR